MLTLIKCCRSLRGLNRFPPQVYEVSLLNRLRLYACPGTVSYAYNSNISSGTLRRFQRQYHVPENYKLIYREPGRELNMMLFLKASQLVLYAIPLWGPAVLHLKGVVLYEFIAQTNFVIAAAIISMYLVLFHYVTNSYVEAIFYNPVTDVYRLFLLQKISLGRRYVEISSDDLKSAGINPKIPMGEIVYKLGDDYILLHDDLFISKSQRYKLLFKARKDWHKDDDDEK